MVKENYYPWASKTLDILIKLLKQSSDHWPQVQWSGDPRMVQVNQTHGTLIKLKFCCFQWVYGCLSQWEYWQTDNRGHLRHAQKVEWYLGQFPGLWLVIILSSDWLILSSDPYNLSLSECGEVYRANVQNVWQRWGRENKLQGKFKNDIS